jgi:hypothetical protein
VKKVEPPDHCWGIIPASERVLGDTEGGVARKCHRLCFVPATEQYGTVVPVSTTLRWQPDER